MKSVNLIVIALVILSVMIIGTGAESSDIQANDLLSPDSTTNAKKIAFYSDYKSIYDTSKSNYGLSYYANALTSKGYDVEQITDPITSSKLEEYDALLIIGMEYELTTDEKNAIKFFVQDEGKGLLLSGGDTSSSSYACNDLGYIFGYGSAGWFGNYIVCDSANNEVFSKWIKVNNFQEHEITENVNEILLYKATNIPAGFTFGVIASAADSDSDSWLDENDNWAYDSGEEIGSQPVIAFSGVDKIVIVADSNVFDNLDADGDGIVAFEEYDNDILGLNIAKWLAGEPSYDFIFKGTLNDIVLLYSMQQYYSITIDEIISDPTATHFIGESVNIWYPYSLSLAEVDAVNIGDKVEVCANDELKLIDDNHYLLKDQDSPVEIKGDYNDDSHVNIIDFAKFAQVYNNPDKYDEVFDFNDDGVINIIDFAKFAQAYEFN